ncbi:MAG: type II 3-dehydroquinate dehydratase [Candidatus Neomarinimicrobiota bacterium]|nr:type II 3-dehydroquinate dehydratase [Candidatus Neomarinimicrobiota bacterium]MEC9274047.1 type II 3-dehydroquinate dehydratase [Candidatus Neomarinimicrobiota bacterium]
MNILIIQGPNLNLIGLSSAKIGEQVTLDKMNQGLRKQAHKRPEEIKLKILQSHKIEKAMTSIHRNKNWANGIIIAPMAWARYEYSLKECLNAVSLPIYEVFLTPEYEFEGNKESSILSSICIQSLCGHPLSIFIDALDLLVNHLSE